jgi:CHRD domain
MMNRTHSSLPRFAITAAIAAATALALSACGGGGGGYDDTPAATPPETITASLSGDQEAPTRITSGAIGAATFSLDRATRTLSGSVALDGIDATLAHIHAGATGIAGAVVLPLTLAAGQPATLAPTVLTDAQLASLDAGGLYVNIHSAANTSGEIRGQLGREVFTASLSGAQETTPVTSAGTGVGVLELNPLTREISGEVEIEGFTSTVAHVHAGAFGANGAVLIPLEDHGGHGHYTVLAKTVLTDAQVASLRTGGLYFNVHSSTNTGGEIRGQIGQRVLLGSASGAQEVPANGSAASGRAFATYDQRTRSLQGSITLTGMTATVAHIHMAPAGGNGPVVFALTETSAGSGVWALPANTTLSAAQAKALLTGGMYFNAHSAAFTAGEIRAQLVAQ